MANPALNEKLLNKLASTTSDRSMTIEGTINKTGILLLCAIAGAVVGWGSSSIVVLLGSMITTLILSFLIIFGPQRAAYLSQPYAFLEGILLGSVSSMYAALYAGIVSKALFLTLGCLACMLALYRFRIIRVTEQLRSMIVAATMAIALTYLVTMVLSFFNVAVPMLHEGSPMGIAFSVVVVGVAAFNLLLDFDLIEQAQQQGAPKYMEWYGGFALLVTLVWLYLEILRLMSKLQKK